MPRLFIRFPFLLLFAVSLHAQTVRWEPGSGTLARNQLSELSLVFEQCEPTDDVTLPTVPGLTFSQPPAKSQQSSYNVVNFKTTSLKIVTFTYRVRPTGNDRITIPAFAVDTDKGRQPVASATFDMGTATVGQSSLSLESVVQSRFTLPPGELWAGEVFPLTYSLNAAKRYLYQLGSEPEWNPAPLTVEPWTKPEQVEAVVNNEQRISLIYKTRAYAKAPGTVNLNTATQLVNLTTGSSSFSVFARANLEQFSITSQPASLTVKPLPAPAPAAFKGAVGKFTLDSKVVPATATVGEPITWTLTLDGTGNWPDISGLPPRSVSKDFRIVQPQAKRVNKNDALYDASITEDIVLIPTKPGAYTIGPVTYTFFNPGTGAYETLQTQPVTLQITAAAGQPTAPSTGKPALPESTTPSIAQPAPSTPQSPAALPRDPITSTGHSSAPISRTPFVIALIASLLVPVGIWFALALRRARQTDPARLLREAHIRLANTLHRLSADTGNLQLIQNWQSDTAILWRLTQAVPTPASFPDETWSTLWSEADRTLYGATALPGDWPSRATTALAARRAPVFSAFQLFLPRNLLPIIAVLSLLVPGLSSFAADTPAASYAQGDFSAAETAWKETLKTTPTDWAARHNLSLALLQQNHSGEAAGHALAAFVQQPQNPSVRGNLVYAFKTVGVTPAALKPFLTDSPAASLARIASPTCWQAVAIASAWLTAFALSLGIYGAYTRRRLKWISGTVLVFATLLGLASVISLHTYGPLTDTSTVMVVTPTTLRSIPTDLDTPQKSSPLALGVIATTDKAFLGWRRIRFDDGQTGWVRSETLVALWR
ncbi:BatD family protein [Rariglobus hedericola]|uniref:Protein BatD n=1 Tax=Rariglobus hedericola TaxID=2597822 RepID=A0A556QQ54_9BACT|nr:BatD family protein [Rariglobus hedericola]TSJ78767.1 protein BatD [Rariglobus hedericola]